MPEREKLNLNKPIKFSEAENNAVKEAANQTAWKLKDNPGHLLHDTILFFLESEGVPKERTSSLIDSVVQKLREMDDPVVNSVLDRPSIGKKEVGQKEM